MRKPTRTTKRWNLPIILHPSQLTPPTNRHPTPTKPNWHSLPPHTKTITPYNKLLMIRANCKPRPTPCLHGQSPPIWSTPMTPQSPRRSPNRRFHTISRTPPKTRRLRYHTNHNPSKPNIKQPTLSIHHLSPMRSTNNQRHLPTTNRPKITNRLLICQPHRTSCSRNHDPDPMSILRGNNPNNFTRLNFINAILPSQHQLRTNPQPNPPSNTRTPTPSTTNSHLMTSSKLNKHSPPSNNKPHGRTNHRHRTIQLICLYNYPNRNSNPTYCLLHSLHTHNNTARPTSIPYHLNPKLHHPRTPPHSPPHNSNTTPYPQTRTNLRYPYMQV